MSCCLGTPCVSHFQHHVDDLQLLPQLSLCLGHVTWVPLHRPRGARRHLGVDRTFPAVRRRRAHRRPTAHPYYVCVSREPECSSLQFSDPTRTDGRIDSFETGRAGIRSLPNRGTDESRK
eukprot:scaffold126_cov315-Pavlova_lutheri.AAC.11